MPAHWFSRIFFLNAAAGAKSKIAALVSGLCGEAIELATKVAHSERAWGCWNAALAPLIRSFGRLDTGGEGGIRTHGSPEGSLDFESSPFDHSGTSPRIVYVAHEPARV